MVSPEALLYSGRQEEGGVGLALDKRVSELVKSKGSLPIENLRIVFFRYTREGPSEGPLDSCGRKKTHPPEFRLQHPPLEVRG